MKLVSMPEYKMEKLLSKSYSIMDINCLMKKVVSTCVNDFGELVTRRDFFKSRTKSFTGKKVAKFNRIIDVPVTVGNEELKCHIAVDKNNSIYDITMTGFGRLTALYYALVGQPFVYAKVKEMLDND